MHTLNQNINIYIDDCAYSISSIYAQNNDVILYCHVYDINFQALGINIISPQCVKIYTQ